jgi:hypothetical protein
MNLYNCNEFLLISLRCLYVFSKFIISIKFKAFYIFVATRFIIISHIAQLS